MTKTHHFEIKNAKIFWGGGHPSPDPIGAYGASIFAPTALKLNVTPPEKILVTALMSLLTELLELRVPILETIASEAASLGFEVN